MVRSTDVVIIGAGAAGLMCALTAAARGRRVLLIERSNKAGKKILMSGGGRCNFTNMYAAPTNFASKNPHFCKSALARYTPWDFIAMVTEHGVPYHEKKLGQLFCDNKSKDILEMLLAECQAVGVELHLNTSVHTIEKTAGGYLLSTDLGSVAASSLVIATGGLSIPTLGATGFGYEIARQFGHDVLPTRAGLVPFTTSGELKELCTELTGTSVACEVSCNDQSFRENILFTHRGLSGPAILQISTYWRPGTPIRIDFTPSLDLGKVLVDAKAGSRRLLANALAEHLPRRFTEAWLVRAGKNGDLPISECRDRDLAELATGLRRWTLTPDGTEGYKKAEVTVGGVDTRELDSATLQSRRRPGLHFIGEVVDVTGWLGGYNFQWAWASAAACARSLRSATVG